VKAMPEGNDPKLAETLDAPVYEPPKRNRSLTGFYIGLGIVATLVGLGVVLYPHLRLQYAIHQVRSATRTDDRGAGEWVELVSEAARRGDGNAIDALIMYHKQGLCGPLWLWQVAIGPAAGRAKLYRRLDQWPDEDVLRSLDGIARYIGDDVWRTDDIEGYRYDDLASGPRGLVANMEPPALKAADPRFQCAAQEIVAYVRRRFAKDLTGEKSLGGEASK